VKGWGRWFVWILLASALVAGVAYSLWPQPVAVETMLVRRGRMQVTVDEDGTTQVRERYQVSSPVAGQLLRIELRSSDRIKAGETLLATIRPSDPALLNAREVAQTEARAAAAEAAVERAEARRSQTKVSADLAEIQFGRAEKLRSSNSIAQDEFDAAEALFRARREEMRVTNFELEIAKFEYEQAQAALGLVQPNNQEFTKNFEIRSPISGSVLRLFEESSTVVTAGKPLLEVGDPNDLQIVVDVLSSDAVKIQPGNEIRIVHWGGQQPLAATVRVVEPAAFTKISALGVEEQRVNVIGDFLDHSRDEGRRLGDGYRVEAEIVVWDEENVLQVPTAALFRESGQWCVFTVKQGKAQQQVVQIGQRNQLMAEVREGLEADSEVVIYPSDQVKEGLAVRVQRTEAFRAP
jgi:HlyD family secretion protein